MIKEVYKGAPDTPELYVPQHHMLEAVEDARDKGVSKCYVDVATGVGKTYAIAHDIKKYLEQKPDARVLYLCHKGQVLEQARDTIADVIDPAVSHGNFYKGQYEDREQIVYATFQQMTGGSDDARNYQAFDPKEFDYIVVDEGHHGPAPTYTEVIEYFDPDFQVGLTATDERMDGKDISEVLGPKVFEYTLEEAIAEGVLVKPDYRLFTEHEADLKDLLIDEDMPPTLKEINDRLTRVQRDRNYQQAIVSEIQAAQAEHEQPRTVIYCPDIQYADEFSELIPEGQSLHSGLSDEEQDARLKAFRRGDIPTLLVVDIFNEGIDVPEINTMVFLRGTESKMIFLQQLGRGLRTSEGKEKVIALDFAASWQRIMLIAELKDKVQTIYRGRGSSSNGYKTGKRPKREYLSPDDMVPFEFSFSKDALDAVNIVEKIRTEKSKPKKPDRQTRSEKWQNVDGILQEMFGLKPFDPSDPRSPQNLPDQRISTEEEAKYAKKIALGDLQAQEEYIIRRLRFVMIRAQKEFESQPQGSSLTLDDHFQNGMESLKKSLDVYNVSKYKRQPNLKKYISMRLWSGVEKPHKDTANTIRLPLHMQDIIKRLAKHKEKFKDQNNREPSNVELAELCGLDEYDIEEIEPWSDMLNNGLDSVEDLYSLIDKHANVVHETSTSLGEQKIMGLLARLGEGQSNVLVERYGLRGEAPKTAETIARGSGMSAARVREIENDALKRLAQDPEVTTIRDAFDDTNGLVEHLAQGFPNIMPAGTNREHTIIRQLYDAYAALRNSQNPDTWENVRHLENRLRIERKRQEEQGIRPRLGEIATGQSKETQTSQANTRDQFWGDLKLQNAPENILNNAMASVEYLEKLESLSISLARGRKLIELMGTKGPFSHWQVRDSRKELSTSVSNIEDQLQYFEGYRPTANQEWQLKRAITKLNDSISKAEYSLSNIFKHGIYDDERF